MILLLFIHMNGVNAQTTDTLHRELMIDAELRPRAEFRDHYMWSIADAEMPKLYFTQRNRLNINYKSKWVRLHASPQEIHVWGESGTISKVGSINFFELYAEPRIGKNLTARIGRQALSLDNGKIFSAAPWSQQSRAHEGIRVMYKNKLETDFTFAFTRSYGERFDVAYSPVASHTYKYLLVHHLKHNFTNHFTLTTINALDELKSTKEENRFYPRITQGGRLEYTLGWFYGTVSAYYQHGRQYGQNAAATHLRAYYIQPEISAKTEKTLVRLGMEVMSGNKMNDPQNISRSFVPLYGVAWKFMGNMNLFTRFPADVNGKGMINPYLFVMYQANKKLSLRGDAHLFYTQYPLIKQDVEIDGKYLGFESDLSLNYKPIRSLEITYGFSFAIAHRRAELLHKITNAAETPIWSYLMVSYTPRLLSRKGFRVRP
jgi:hypothetical protein